ncbi:YgaB family protein [Robertmurraya massiliosenegalensis]|uniref:YgaB family protein n=1 Tax=Robertmurraya massiliosenegalensis TaxID=1287657 RepID=UPI0002F73C31|nr:YgaB family protein [Robertmurraya massiliosenegalensis]
MNKFNRLVSEQMDTMEKLLFLQSEIERCQGLEKELIELQEQAKLESIQQEIASKKAELKEIHEMFEQQTEELIQSYQDVRALV